LTVALTGLCANANAAGVNRTSSKTSARRGEQRRAIAPGQIRENDDFNAEERGSSLNRETISKSFPGINCADKSPPYFNGCGEGWQADFEDAQMIRKNGGTQLLLNKTFTVSYKMIQMTP
jgi:hypothetical protein